MNKSIIIIGITTTLFLSQAVVAKDMYRLQMFYSFNCMNDTCVGGTLKVWNNSDSKQHDTKACLRGPQTYSLNRDDGGWNYTDYFGHCNGHTQTDGSHVEFTGEVYRDDIKCGTLTWPSNGESYTWEDNGGETCKFASSKGTYDPTEHPTIEVENSNDCNGGSGNCMINIIINYSD